MSDMLVYPGDNVSRYVKRIQLGEALGEDLRNVRAKLEALEQALASGVISRQQYETERSEKAKLEDELLKQQNKIGLRRAVSIHMETFYGRGGALRQGTTYLIGLNDSGELEELPSNTDVYWGSIMEDIVRVLNE